MKPTLEMIEGCRARYADFVSRQLSRTRWYDDPLMVAQREQRERWISERREYLDRALKNYRDSNKQP